METEQQRYAVGAIKVKTRKSRAKNRVIAMNSSRSEGETMEEIYKKWHPLPESVSQREYDLSRLIQEYDFCIEFENGSKIIKIRFESVLAYRKTSDSDRWRTVDDILARYGGDYFADCMFYIVDNSLFKKWYSDETFGKWKDECIHYTFTSDTDFIDVLSLVEPVVTYSE